MSFWEANRKLLVGVGLSLLAALAVHLIAAGPRRSAAVEIEQGNEGLRHQIRKLLPPSGITTPQARQMLLADREGLEKVITGLRGLLLEISPSSKYRVPKGEIDPKFYFQKQLDLLRRERCDGRPYPSTMPLGFTDQLKKEKADQLLERLAAADRLTAAAERAGLARVRGIRHGKISLRGAKGVKDMHLALLPMIVSATTDERGLISFLQEISRRDRFLALEAVNVEVTSPNAKTLNMTVTVTALVPRKGTGPKSGRTTAPRGARPLPIGRY